MFVGTTGIEPMPSELQSDALSFRKTKLRYNPIICLVGGTRTHIILAPDQATSANWFTTRYFNELAAHRGVEPLFLHTLTT